MIEEIIKYVDAKVEYELARIEVDESGYVGSDTRTEEKAMEKAKRDLMDCTRQ